jgi:uncharacterized repeat protein (TIGR01451 family)
VVVTDPVPDGLSHESGQKELSFNVGDLAPGQTKALPVTFKTEKRGRLCNVATATSSNAGKVSAEACVQSALVEIKIEKSTTDKEQIVGRKAGYKIVISNTGDVDVPDLTLTDTAPEGTQILAAEGASVSGNTATWTGITVPKGGSKSYEVALTSAVSGNKCNVATLVTAKGVRMTSEACTVWRGVPGVLLEMVDDPDPIQVGETTTYTVRVTNQGFASLHDLLIAVEFDEEADPVSSPQGSVQGKKVTFPLVATLEAKQSFTYTVVAKGVSAGDARNKCVLTVKELKTSVEETESTTVY